MKLALLLLIFSSTALIANDCVDCIYGLEGFPKVESLSEAACSDCDCYTRTHEETIKSLNSERSSLIRKNLSGLIKGNIDLSIQNLAELDRLAKGIPDFKLGENCSLNQIKTNVVACSSDAGPEQLKALFGHESIDAFLSEIGTKFSNAEGGDNSSNSCLSSSQLAHMKSLQVLGNLSTPLFVEIKNKKAELLSLLNSDAKIPEILEKKDNDTLKLFFTSLHEHPLAQAALLDKSALKYIVTNIEEFIGKQGKGIDFFTREVFEMFPQVKNNLKVSVGAVCGEFINSISEIACSGDSISLINDKNTSEKILSYYPDDHKSGYDSMFVMDKSDADPIESSYVDHIYWCAAESCSKNKKIAACNGLNFKPKLNSAVGDIAYQSNVFDQFNKNLPSYSEESLCKLATCSGSQEQMNACYEGVRGELGEDADSILLSFDRATRSTRENSSQDQSGSTPLFTPEPFVRSEFASNFLGEFAGESQANPGQTVAANSSNNGQANSSGNNRAAASDRSTTLSASGGSVTSNSAAPVVTASQAFSQFMDQRFSEIARSPSSFSARNRRNSVRVASNGNSEVERQALRSLNRASETIDEMRDSYRQNAFDRMERLFEQAKRQNNTQSNSIANNSTSSGFNSSFSGSGSSASRAVSGVNAQGARLPSPSTSGAGAGSTGGGSGAEQLEASQGAGATSRGVASTSGSSPARVTTQNGQPTLNVSVGELPRITELRVENDGVDTSKPFQLAVKVNESVYVVQVRPAVLRGRKMLEPMLDSLSPSLRAEVLRSPLFKEYRDYLLSIANS